MKKILISLVILIATQILSLQQTFAAGHFCSNPVDTTSTLGNGAGLFDCWNRPTIQRVKFYKVAACKQTLGAAANAIPNAATLAAAGCHTIWENAAGSDIDVALGSVFQPPGAVTMPAEGSWPIMYLEIDATFRIQQDAIAFNNPVRALIDEVPVAPGGTFCKTNAGTSWNFGASPGNATCAATVVALDGPTGALATHNINALVPGAGNGLKGFISEAGVADIVMIKANNSRFNPDTDCAGGIGDTCAEVATPAGTKIAAWLTTNSILTTINNCYFVGFSNSKGSNITGSVAAGADPAFVFNFEAGDFEMNLSTQCN